VVEQLACSVLAISLSLLCGMLAMLIYIFALENTSKKKHSIHSPLMLSTQLDRNLLPASA
jgi:hypothetical protein